MRSGCRKDGRGWDDGFSRKGREGWREGGRDVVEKDEEEL